MNCEDIDLTYQYIYKPEITSLGTEVKYYVSGWSDRTNKDLPKQKD